MKRVNEENDFSISNYKAKNIATRLNKATWGTTIQYVTIISTELATELTLYSIFFHLKFSILNYQSFLIINLDTKKTLIIFP